MSKMMKAFNLAMLIIAFGCGEHGSNIPIDPPSCVDSVTDECVPEVIEEFCTECNVQAVYNEGYSDGFRACGELRGQRCDPLAGYDQGFIDGLAAAGIICDYSIPEGHRPKVCPDSRGE